MDVDAHRLVGPVGESPLTVKETELLSYLARVAGTVSRSTLQTEVWGYHPDVQSRAVHHCVTRLRRKLAEAGEPECLQTVRGRGYRLRTTSSTPSLPSLPSLYGRHEALGGLEDALGPGVLTLVATAGMGKTTLALALAHRLAASGSEVRWCALEALSTAAEIRGAVARVLGVPPDRIEAALGPVLFLDNAEHVVEPLRHLLTDWGRAAPSARFVLTSRVMVGVAGERRWPVPPLGLPATADAVSESPAVAMLRERCAAAGGSLDAEDEAIHRLVHAVDGVPLALELAAGRVRMFGVEALARRLQRTVADLSRVGPERHRSLEAALQQSWSVLSTDEKRVLSQLSVFEGAVEAETIEGVMGGGVLEVVARLLDSELVCRRDGLTLLNTVRVFARAKLAENPVLYAALQQVHGRYFAAMGTTSAMVAVERSPAAAKELARYRRELVRATHWAVDAGEPVLAVQALRAATHALRAHADHAATVPLARAVLRARVPPVAEAEVSLILARGLEQTGQLTAAPTHAVHALTLARQEEDVRWEAESLSLLAQLSHRSGDREVALRYIEDAVACAEGDLRADVLAVSGRIHAESGLPDVAEARFERALSLFERQGREASVAPILINAANVCRARGQTTLAAARYVRAASLAESSGQWRVHAGATANHAALLHLLGHGHEARRLYATALGAYRRLGDLHYEGIFQGTLAELVTDEGDFEQAERALDRAEWCHRRLGEQTWVWVTTGRRGVLALRRGQLVDARRCLDSAHRALESLLPQGAAIFLGHLAEALALDGRWPESAAAFAAALRAMEVGGWNRERFLCLCAQARVLATREPDVARAALEAARGIELPVPAGSQLARHLERAVTRVSPS